MSSSKEKAKELADKFSKYTSGWNYDELAKQCALIAVDEIIRIEKHHMHNLWVDYWKKVKQEIEKL